MTFACWQDEENKTRVNVNNLTVSYSFTKPDILIDSKQLISLPYAATKSTANARVA